MARLHLDYKAPTAKQMREPGMSCGEQGLLGEIDNQEKKSHKNKEQKDCGRFSNFAMRQVEDM